MTLYRRFAVYYAPEAGSPLAKFGASWLGWDADTGQPVAHPEIDLNVAAITDRPRKYGFHGTLKPPFRLAEGADMVALEQAIAALAADIAPSISGPLQLARLGQFIALIPSGDTSAISALAARCVTDLDDFRAPLSDEELARRRKGGLTRRQEALLLRWGYPFVLDEFRFHLTLTGPVQQTDPVMAALAPRVGYFLIDDFRIDALCLFGEREDGMFEIITRFPLGA